MRATAKDIRSLLFILLLEGVVVYFVPNYFTIGMFAMICGFALLGIFPYHNGAQALGSIICIGVALAAVGWIGYQASQLNWIDHTPTRVCIITSHGSYVCGEPAYQ